MNCDQTFNYMSNGDDFFALTESGAISDNYVIHDKIGDFGPDPGSGWPIAGILDATKDHTLIRKNFINLGIQIGYYHQELILPILSGSLWKGQQLDFTPQTLGSHNVQNVSPEYSLSFDGVDDYVYSSNINYDLTDGGSAVFL